MSKTTKKVVKQPLAPSTKRTIWITVICVVMAIVLAVSLALVLRQPDVPTDDDGDSDNGSSTLYIKNGDFAYFDDESETFPKSADNWTAYTYKAPDGDDHHFDEITDTEKVVYGVVDTNEDVWADVQKDVADAGVTHTLTNPGIHDEDLDTNVYMFATKQATSASIMSSSFSIGSQTSAKITIWLNTSLLAEGSRATISVQRYSSSNLSAADDDRYAYSFDIEKAEGWKAYELYVFNRETGSRSVICTVGIGNSYTGGEGSGVLFVDDITYETVSANEYRKFVANTDNTTNYGIIGEDDEIAADEYATVTNIDGSQATVITLDEYLALADAQVEGEAYSPFTNNDHFSIYYVTNNGTVKDPVALTLDTWNGQPIVVRSSEDLKDHLHISFWVRVDQNNVTAQGNIMLQSYREGKWQDLTNGSFTAVVTSQEIDTDNNCGWTKYDIYLKPTSAAETTVRVVYALGNANGYPNEGKYTPNGTLYITSPYVEQISASEYSSASSGTYSKKVSLVGDTSSTTVTNGSFSNVSTSNPNQPTNWTPVFAGYNLIYKDGKGNDVIDGLVTNQTAVNGLVVRNNAENNAPFYDDSEQNILKITNNVATAYGYLSSDITLSANTVYAFSVLAKTDSGAKPFFYVVRSGADSRSEAVIGKIEASAGATVADDEQFGMVASSEEGNGWARYYIVIATGDEGMTVRVALFNGSIDGSQKQQGTVYYDYVAMNTLGTYSVDVDEESDKTTRERITFTAAEGYTVFEELTDEEITALAENSNVDIYQPDWEALVEEAMAEDTTEDAEETPAEKQPVDVGLLLSVISSVALVCALLVVLVIRIFRRRNNV